MNLHDLKTTYWDRYTALEWSIIPISPKSKRPLIPWQKHQFERTTPVQARKWQEHWPSAGIAVVTGSISGVFVLDVDEIPEEGATAKERAQIEIARSLVERVSKIPTAVARTAKGRHFYFRVPISTASVGFGRLEAVPRIIPTKVRFLPGLDVRAEGGYALLPPSIHPSGFMYVWEQIPEDGIADAPPELLAAIMEHSSAVLESHVGKDGSITWKSALAGAPDGQRNASATKVVGKMLESTPEDLWPLQWDALKAWNERCTPPLPETELRTTFESIAKKELNKRVERGLEIHQVSELEGVELPPPPTAVKNLIVGLTLLVAKPKIGKSTLALQAALSVINGVPMFDGAFETDEGLLTWDTEAGTVFYLDLEDSAGRLRSRVEGMNNGRLPKDLHYSLQATTMVEGGLVELARAIERMKPHLKLVIIDMFQTFAGTNDKALRNAYQAEYQTMRLLWDLSNRYNVPILVLQHARKDAQVRGKGDPFDAISGTLGGPGAADTIIVMQEKKTTRLSGARGARVVSLSVRGRDVPDYEISLTGNPRTKRWKIGAGAA